MAFGQVKSDSSIIDDTIFETENFKSDDSKSYFIEATEIKNVCETIDAMIDRHIFVQKQSHCKWNKDTDYLRITIASYYDKLLTDSTLFELIYSTNDLSNKPFEIELNFNSDVDTIWYPDWNSLWYYYQIYASVLYFFNKDTREMFGIMNAGNVYFYEHEKCNVFIVSPLSLIFEEVGTRIIEFEPKIELENDYLNRRCNGQLFQTFYILTKDTLQEVRYRDVVPFINKREMFK